jgi:hypothetical protein
VEASKYTRPFLPSCNLPSEVADASPVCYDAGAVTQRGEPITMSKKMSTPQKQRRTLQGTDPGDGRLGKRPVKTPRVGEKQLKGDKRIRKEVG